MIDISETEALELLSKKLYCRDYGSWALTPGVPDAYYLTCGLLTESGDNARLFVEVMAKTSGKTNIHHHTFTVFRPRPYNARVYQLEVRTCPKALRDKHQRTHEHMGKARVTIAGNRDWGFKNALKHFQEKTRIEFIPELKDPLEFDLEMS